jgi:DNA-binding transcriptional regulator PaaX
MKTEEIKTFVDKMVIGDISIFLKLYTQECYKEMVEMGWSINQTYEEYVEDWKSNIDDLL